MVETYDFMNFRYYSISFIVLSCDSSLFSVFSALTVFELSTLFVFHYFIEKVLFPKIKRLNQYVKPIKLFAEKPIKLFDYSVITRNK